MVAIESLGKQSPAMPYKKREKLAKADRKWDLATYKVEDLTEEDIFERKYMEAANYYLSQATESSCKIILQMFKEAKPVVRAALKEFVHSPDKVDGSFVGDLAEASDEVTLRALCEDTFANASYTNTPPSGGGDMHLVPNVSGTETATEDEQTWLIFGYAEFKVDTPVISRVQETLDDSEKTRRTLEVYLQQVLSDMQIFPRSSILWVETGGTIDIDAHALSDTTTGFFPIGIEICTANQVSDISP